MFKESDVGPMLLNFILIIVGTPLAIWLLSNPQVIADVRAWLTGHDVWMKLGMFLAFQPLMLVFWLWLKRRQGPFSIEREAAPGHWQHMALSNSLKQAKELAHDCHRRVLNIHGTVIYHGR